MPSRRDAAMLACVTTLLFTYSAPAQQPPPPSAARILLLPRKIVSGERATLAVLDVNGRLTPGVAVEFSNGDHFTTDQSGRALFVAPLNPGTIFGSIAGRSGRVQTVIISPTEVGPKPAPTPSPDSTPSGSETAPVPASSVPTPAVISAPRFASLSDRFDISGYGFCGEADANTVKIGGHRALVLASAPTSLVILPPNELEPGTAAVEIICAKNKLPAFRISFLALELHGNSSPLAPGEHRQITVSVGGTAIKVPLEAKNLAPDIAELVGGTVVRHSSTGGPQNAATFELIGRQRGTFLISIRLVPTPSHPSP